VHTLFIIGIGQLMLLVSANYSCIGRFSLFVVALGLLALGQVLMTFERIVFLEEL